MCTEEGGADFEGGRFPQAADDAQHLELVRRVESVTAFDFYAACSASAHLVESLLSLKEEFFLRLLV